MRALKCNCLLACVRAGGRVRVHACAIARVCVDWCMLALVCTHVHACMRARLKLCSSQVLSNAMAYVVMACIVTAYIVMAYIIMVDHNKLWPI